MVRSILFNLFLSPERYPSWPTTIVSLLAPFPPLRFRAYNEYEWIQPSVPVGDATWTARIFSATFEPIAFPVVVTNAVPACLLAGYAAAGMGAPRRFHFVLCAAWDSPGSTPMGAVDAESSGTPAAALRPTYRGLSAISPAALRTAARYARISSTACAGVLSSALRATVSDAATSTRGVVTAICTGVSWCCRCAAWLYSKRRTSGPSDDSSVREQ